MVDRVRERLFPPRAKAPLKPAARSRREINFRASLAEMLLILRLRARSRTSASQDVLERGAHVVDVTCKNWFGQDASEKSPASRGAI